MNIFKRIKARLSQPEKALAALRPELEKLAAGLEKVMRDSERDPLSAITPFFSITSAWHDRRLSDIIELFARVNDGQYDKIIGKLATLERQFDSAGRSEYGWNRTTPGEEVTPDKVFLGDIFGMPTKPVSYWQQKDPNEREDFWFRQFRNPRGAVSAQAQAFIKNHAPIMAERARELAA